MTRKTEEKIVLTLISIICLFTVVCFLSVVKNQKQSEPASIPFVPVISDTVPDWNDQELSKKKKEELERLFNYPDQTE